MKNIDHQSKVTKVQERVRELYAQKKQAKIYHGATNNTRSLGSAGLKYVDMSSFDQVVAVNEAEGYVLVEPNVPLDKLVDAVTKHGFVPPVVAEFPGITVGGAVQGGSGESSSFINGSFHDTCLEYEIVLGNGDKVTANRQQNADLFWGMSCAYGSLGILTLLKIKLVPATRYVKLTYHRTTGHDDAVKKLQKLCKTKVDFVDGILLSPQSGVIVTGEYSDETDLPKARFARLRDEWFYLHAEKVTAKKDGYQELAPLKDYLFRYDRGAFWVAKYGFEKVPFNRFNRVFFAPILKTRTLFKAVHASGYAYKIFAQDICLPQASVVDFLEFSDQEFGLYPLWLCPLKPAKNDKLTPTYLDTKLVINVGLWGHAKPSASSFKERNRLIEKRVHQLGGRKVLYAHAYYTDQEFWDIYDKPAYDKLRRKYKATTVFPDVYQKIKTRPLTFKPSKLKGLAAILKSPYKKK